MTCIRTKLNFFLGEAASQTSGLLVFSLFSQLVEQGIIKFTKTSGVWAYLLWMTCQTNNMVTDESHNTTYTIHTYDEFVFIKRKTRYFNWLKNNSRDLTVKTAEHKVLLSILCSQRHLGLALIMIEIKHKRVTWLHFCSFVAVWWRLIFLFCTNVFPI